MFKIALATFTALTVLAVAPTLVQAKSIKAQMTPGQTSSYCLTSATKADTKSSLGLGNGTAKANCAEANLTATRSASNVPDENGSESPDAAEGGAED